MKNASESKTIIRGIKGPSPMVALKHFDNVNSYVIDYMHCILLGVVKSILRFAVDILGVDLRQRFTRQLFDI